MRGFMLLSAGSAEKHMLAETETSQHHYMLYLASRPGLLRFQTVISANLFKNRPSSMKFESLLLHPPAGRFTLRQGQAAFSEVANHTR